MIMIVDTAATGCVFTAIQAHANRRDTNTAEQGRQHGREGEEGWQGGMKHHSTELAAAYQTPNIDNDGSHDAAACSVIGGYAKNTRKSRERERQL